MNVSLSFLAIGDVRVRISCNCVSSAFIASSHFDQFTDTFASFSVCGSVGSKLPLSAMAFIIT